MTKYLVENAENSISEPLDFKIFWGEEVHAFGADLGLKGRKGLATPLVDMLWEGCKD